MAPKLYALGMMLLLAFGLIGTCRGPGLPEPNVKDAPSVRQGSYTGRGLRWHFMDSMNNGK